MSDFDIDRCGFDLATHVVGHTGDEELDRMVDDLRHLVVHKMAERARYDVEAEEYAASVSEFKRRWIHRTEAESLSTYMEALYEHCDELCAQMRGEFDVR